MSLEKFKAILGLMPKGSTPNWFARFFRKQTFNSFVGLLDSFSIFLERIIIIAGLLMIIFWGYKIFKICDPASINKAGVFMEYCHKYWIGLLLFLPFMFYRLIVLKITELEEAFNMKWRKATPTNMEYVGGISSIQVNQDEH